MSLRRVAGSDVELGKTRDRERPQHSVTFAKPFLVGRFEVTFDQYEACARTKKCPIGYAREMTIADDHHWGRGTRPVIFVTWSATQSYVAWLSKKTGKRYRLLSEAEWEYAGRGGTTTPFFNGTDTLTEAEANFMLVYPNVDLTSTGRSTKPVGSYAPNRFGLFDMFGNVNEWVQDCWSDTYANAPADGRPVTSSPCAAHVIRGGGLYDSATALRSAYRSKFNNGYLMYDLGFRVARDQ